MLGKTVKALLVSVFSVCILQILASVGNATLIGDRFDCDNSFNFLQPGNVCETSSGTSNILIGAGIEVTTINFEVDIDATSITMTNVGQSDIAYTLSSNTIEFTSLDWVDLPLAVITGFTLETDVSGFDTGNVTTSDHGVTLFVNEVWQAGEFIKVNLETSHAVPTPSTLALFGLGLAGLCILSRRRRQERAS